MFSRICSDIPLAKALKYVLHMTYDITIPKLVKGFPRNIDDNIIDGVVDDSKYINEKILFVVVMHDIVVRVI